MQRSSLNFQILRWLLKDKYHWTDAQIAEFLNTIKVGEAVAEALFPDLENDLQRLDDGEPIQYVIGWVHFLGCIIDLSYKPLIPRPETEFWVEKILKQYAVSRSTQNLKILDLCCGSGCIGIASLSQLQKATVDFVDIDPKAIDQTQKNLDLNHILPDRYHIVQSNLFSEIENKKYDFILTNPPYVDPELPAASELAYEPKQALFAQNHGLAVIEKIISHLEKHLKPQGKCVIEFGLGQENEIANLLKKQNFASFTFEKDQYDVIRYVMIIASPKL